MEDLARVCFVISPIGSEGEEVRLRANKFYDYIVKPAAKECGYTPVRADEISGPDVINIGVIQHLVHAGMAVADLTGLNPNVFYELGVRHAFGRPVVQMISVGERLPFDVAGIRTIPYDFEVSSATKAKAALENYMRTATTEGAGAQTLLGMVASWETLRAGGDPRDRVVTDIVSTVHELLAKLDNVTANGFDPSAEYRRRYRVVAYLKRFVEQRLGEIDVPKAAGVSSWRVESDDHMIYLHGNAAGKEHVAGERVRMDWPQKSSWSYACSVADALVTMLRNLVASDAQTSTT